MNNLFSYTARYSPRNVLKKCTQQTFCTSCIRRGVEIPRPMRRAAEKTSVPVGAYFLLVVPAAGFALGTWQVKRRKWKLNLIEELEKKALASPVPFPLDLEEIKDLEYQRILVRGEFDHTREMYLHPRQLNTESSQRSSGLISTGRQIGAHVVTPFKLADRDLTILVNRGYVNKKYMHPETRPDGQIKGEVELVGVIRKTEKRPPGGSKVNIRGNQCQRRDVEAMAEILDTDPIFIDADSASTVRGGPIGGQTRVSIRNEHMSYILTWYTLTVITAYMWYARFLKR